jgi:outer membrane lipoprotein-sorting protein
MIAKTFKKATRITHYFAFAILLSLLLGCTKKDEEPQDIKEVDKPVYSYEVTCNSCEIQFSDQNKNQQKISHTSGKWSYTFTTVPSHDLKIIIKTISSTYQNINAYIVKNDEVIYGDLGYNTVEILYNVASGQKSMIAGTYINPPVIPPSGGTTTPPSQPSQPTSSLCGARTKAGGSCKRVVIGGGRCWQHR